MKRFYKTTTGILTPDLLDQPDDAAVVDVVGHYHIVFIDDENQLALASIMQEDGHTHEVVWQQPQPQMQPIDPNNPQQAPQPQAPLPPGQWVIMPANDGHTHELTDYEPEYPQKKEPEEEVVRDVLELLRVGLSLEREAKEMAKVCRDFRHGRQWDAETKQRLEDLSRAALTVNAIGRSVDELCGHQRQNRQDIKYVPTEEGDQRVADLYTVVSKHVLDKCFYAREESKCFEDAVIGGRGNLELRIDFSRNLQGDIVVDRFDDARIVYGPHEKDDASDAEWLVKFKMYSLAKAKQLWGDKADELGDYVSHVAALGVDSPEVSEHVQYAQGQYAKSDNWYPVTAGDQPLLDIAQKEICVVECQRVSYNRVYVAIAPDFGFFQALHGWGAEARKKVGSIPGFSLAYKDMPEMRISRVAGAVLLSDENPADVPFDSFSVVPIYCHKDGNNYHGKVEPAIDLQMEINKRHSQAVDIGNKMAAYGWFYDEDIFPDSNAKEHFKNNATSPGFVQIVRDISRLPRQVEGVQFPREIVELMSLSDQKLKDMMNITVEQMGANESASMFAHKQRQRLIGNEHIFDNLTFAKMRLGKMLLKAIRRYYTPERIYRIVSSESQKNESGVEVGGQPFGQFSQQEIVDLLANADVDVYDVEVAEVNYSPSMLLTTHLLLGEMAKAGAPIPPQALIQTSPLPEAHKRNILQSMEAQQQAQQQAEQAKQQAEIQKTLIAKGGVPQGQQPPVM